MLNRRDFLRYATTGAAGLLLSPLARATSVLLDRMPVDEQGNRFAEGTVFENLDGSGKLGSNPPIAGVCVSNGREVVRTDRNGRWKLPVEDGTILFVIKPSGWQVPLDEDHIPKYYYIHKPAGSPAFKYAGVKPTGELPASVDFGLTRQAENSKFNMILFGDPQPRNQREIDFMAHDVIEQVIRDAAQVDAKFGLSLGDIMFNDLSLYGSLNRTIAEIGLPWYNTVGNHDLNFDAQDHETSTESFKAAYGPTYYAFNYAKVHFIVLNNVLWHGAAADGKAGGFHGEINPSQIEFIKNDLAMVPKDRLVVVAMHIPPADFVNRKALYSLLEGRPHTFSISAHTHVQDQYFLTEEDGWTGPEPHHHLNHATVCGSWWGGNPDERGIPHATMTDGCPNGYSVIEFDGAKYKVNFRPASRPVDEQMSIWCPEAVAFGEGGEVLVNVFTGWKDAIVEVRIGTGNWTRMQQTRQEDPYYLKLKEAEVGTTPPKGYYRMQPPTKTAHIWSYPLSKRLSVGTHRIEIRTTDLYGKELRDSRLVRVE